MDLVSGLDAFAAVARTGSFTEAADRLRQPQSVVSRRVAALEQELGVNLFERTSRRVQITEAGARILPRVDDLLSQVSRIRRLASGPDTGWRLGLPPGLDPRALAAISRSAPSAVRIDELPPAERVARWEAGSLDVGLLPSEPATADLNLALGVAGLDLPEAEFRLRHLRRSRAERTDAPRTLLVGVEDTRPARQDRLDRAAAAAGLRRDQVAYGVALPEALVRAHERSDVLLATQREASQHGLPWRPWAASAWPDAPPVRCWRLVIADGVTLDRDRLIARFARAAQPGDAGLEPGHG